VDGSPNVGPTGKGLFGHDVEVRLPDGSTQIIVADEEYLKEAIVQPAAKIVKGFQNVMPSYEGRFSDEELKALIEYIKSLR
jgi:cytochrome c oxidase subunit 2